MAAWDHGRGAGAPLPCSSVDSLPTAIQTRDMIVSGAMSAERAVGEALERLSRLDARLNAFVESYPEHALARARAIDRDLRAGRPAGPLAGVPVAIKDNLCLADPPEARTTAGSRMLGAYHSPFTATAVQRLVDAGAVVIGKTNLDEFAMGSGGEHSAHGPTRNPWDTSRSPGGSSSGSAAAVAAGIVPLALGSDTGGSIRQPAGMCGIVGLKPTYGCVSRYGLVAYASSLDQVGPMARSVADAGLALSVIAGRDPLDATSAEATEHWAMVAASGEPMARQIVVGVPRQARSAANHPSVSAGLARAEDALRSAGARVVEVDLPRLDEAIAAYYLIATAESSSNLARYDGVRYGHRAALGPGEGLATLYARSRAEGFGPEVRRRIMLGTFVLSAGYAERYYVAAQKVRRLIRDDHDRVFAPPPAGPGCDALLLPTSPEPARLLGPEPGAGDPMREYLSDVYTVAANLAGLPAIAVPAGPVAGEGASLPVGVQLVGPAWSEPTLLRIAGLIEAGLPGVSGRVAPVA